MASLLEAEASRLFGLRTMGLEQLKQVAVQEVEVLVLETLRKVSGRDEASAAARRAAGSLLSALLDSCATDGFLAASLEKQLQVVSAVLSAKTTSLHDLDGALTEMQKLQELPKEQLAAQPLLHFFHSVAAGKALLREAQASLSGRQSEAQAEEALSALERKARSEILDAVWWDGVLSTSLPAILSTANGLSKANGPIPLSGTQRTKLQSLPGLVWDHVARALEQHFKERFAEAVSVCLACYKNLGMVPGVRSGDLQFMTQAQLNVLWTGGGACDEAVLRQHAPSRPSARTLQFQQLCGSLQSLVQWVLGQHDGLQHFRAQEPGRSLLVSWCEKSCDQLENFGVAAAVADDFRKTFQRQAEAEVARLDA